MNILNFPKDILVLLIKEYFDGQSAFNCFAVCKLLHKYATQERKIVIKKYLVYLTYENYREYIEDVHRRMCSKCNQILKTKNALKAHMQKHEKNPNKKYQMHKLPRSCPHCNLPFLNDHYNHPNKCKLRRVHCLTYDNASYYKWLTSLCTKPEGYIGEMKNHTCEVICNECKGVFSSQHGITDDSHIRDHYRNCPNSKDMVSKYRVRKFRERIIGDVTHEDWICYYCEDDSCKCICEKCGKNNANKIIDEELSIKYICRDCATCTKCGIKWKTLNVNDQVWKYEQPPFCRECLK